MEPLKIWDNKFPGNWRATVVSNLDPDFLGRIKVRAYPMFADMSDEGLPWATPALPIFTGAGAGYGNFAVPEIGSEVWVFFENMDAYQPVYFAEAQTRTLGLPAARKTAGDPESYPFIKVMKTKNGIQIKINDYFVGENDNRDIRVDHPAGSWAEFFPDGRVTLHTTTVEGTVLIETDEADVNVLAKKGDISVTAEEGNISAVADLGAIDVEATVGAVTIQGATVQINPI